MGGVEELAQATKVVVITRQMLRNRYFMGFPLLKLLIGRDYTQNTHANGKFFNISPFGFTGIVLPGKLAGRK